jgi:small subunit ribosomal protein S6
MRGQTKSVEEVIDALKKDLEAVHAEVIDVENIGTKDFVRTPDREFRSGIFVQIDFRSPGSAPQALHERLRLNKTVNRVIVQSA